MVNNVGFYDHTILFLFTKSKVCTFMDLLDQKQTKKTALVKYKARNNPLPPNNLLPVSIYVGTRGWAYTPTLWL